MNLNKSKPIILCAQQRSGTNLLRNALRATQLCKSYAEIFNEKNNLKKEYSFFNFKLKQLQNNLSLSFPSSENKHYLFNHYFSFLQNESNLPFHIIDIKYNSWHHFNTIWHSVPERPQLLEWLMLNDLPVIHIVRKNLLHQYISIRVANSTGKYHFKSNENNVQNAVIRVKSDHCKNLMTMIEKESQNLKNLFSSYSNYHSIFYEEIVNENKFFSKINNLVKQVTNGKINELGEPPLKKVIRNPFEHIQNKDELTNSLKNTNFEYYL